MLEVLSFDSVMSDFVFMTVSAHFTNTCFNNTKYWITLLSLTYKGYNGTRQKYDDTEH